MWWRAALLVCLAQGAAAQNIVSADYSDPTTRYDHGILGDAIEWGGVVITATDSAGVATAWAQGLPQDRVFEDLAPRLWDVTGDGAPEVVVIVSHVDLGASLVAIGLVDGVPQQIAATPYIGRTHRWLAPVGAADLDGDGRVEVAYIDRPHLAKVLRLVVKDGDRFRVVAELAGLTNHRIGEDVITGGLRDCGQGPELVTVNGDWTQVMVSRFDGHAITARAVAAFDGAASVDAVLGCAG